MKDTESSDPLIVRLKDGTLSRRKLLALAGSAGFTTVLGSLASLESARAAPKSGGLCRAGLTGMNTTDSLDPATWGTSFAPQLGVGEAVYNHLVEIDPNGELVAELARSWEGSSDFRTWTFELRKGITFQDGKSLVAGDVIDSINHHRGENSQSGVKSILEPITDIRADGSNVVVFELSEGNADFPYLLTNFQLVIGPSRDGQMDWDNPVGTGGYRLVMHDPGVRMQLERTGQYWMPGRGYFDQVELIGINDDTARSTALVSGEVDVINRPERQTLHLLQRNPDIAVDEVPSGQHYVLSMSCQTDPFTDRNVRLALKCGIDRQELVDKVLQGRGEIANDQPIAPIYRYYADLPQREYDPERARYHLKQAGHDSLTVTLWAADAAFPGAVDTGVLYQSQAGKAGITINVTRTPKDGYWSNVWMKKPFFTSFWLPRPTEDMMFSIAYAGTAPWNETRWRNERFDQLLLAARADRDENRRREMYGEMQSMVRDDGGAVIPMFASLIAARSKSIQHEDVIGGRTELDDWKFIERWWHV